MVVMSWDHSRDYVSDQTSPANQGSETWSGPLGTYDNSVRLWLSRFVSHICAPVRRERAEERGDACYVLRSVLRALWCVRVCARVCVCARVYVQEDVCWGWQRKSEDCVD